MSIFKKRRSKRRKLEEKERKLKEEHSKQFEKAMNDHLETCKIIKRDYPGYNNMKPENALKLYNEIYNKVHNENIR